MFQPSSPTRRRESTPLLEKLKTDAAAVRLKVLNAMEKGKDEPKKQEKPREELPIQKYIRMQVRGHPLTADKHTNRRWHDNPNCCICVTSIVTDK